MWETNLRQRTFQFASTLLDLYPRIAALGPPFAHMALQLFEAGSAIGANLEEGEVAASRRDMGLKHAIALREARESHYWLRLLIYGKAFVDELRPLLCEANEFVAMLTTSVKKLRSDGPGTKG
jgi:four helix bundle protein